MSKHRKLKEASAAFTACPTGLLAASVSFASEWATTASYNVNFSRISDGFKGVCSCGVPEHYHTPCAHVMCALMLPNMKVYVRPHAAVCCYGIARMLYVTVSV